MIKLTFTTLIIFLMISIAFTQQLNINSSKKIAFVNEAAFDNKKTGIEKLARAYNQMGSLDCFPAPCSQEYYNKTSKIIVKPVLTEISNSLKQIGNQNNLVILHAFELDSKGLLLAVNKDFEITEQFISFFNKKFDKLTETLRFNIPESKIGVINTNEFFDKLKGIKRILKTSPYKAIDSATFCGKTTVCQELGDSIQLYAVKKGYSVVFDSSKILPEEINKFEKDDLTEEFIFEYNKNNP